MGNACPGNPVQSGRVNLNQQATGSLIAAKQDPYPMFRVSDSDVAEVLKQAQCTKETEECEWLCPICQTLVFDPMSCLNCEPLYCRGCLLQLKNQKCPTCNQDKNFNPVNLKLKNMLMDLYLKGCPSTGCNLAGTPLTYQALLKHLTSECGYIKGTCSFQCGMNLTRNEISGHRELCPKYKIKCPHCQKEGNYFDQELSMHVTCSKELFKLVGDQKGIIDDLLRQLAAKDQNIAELNGKIS